MKYMLNRDMNANTENVYYTNYTSSELSRQLEQLPFVRDIGQATGYPGYFGMTLRGRGDAPSLAMMYCDSIAFRIFDFNIVEQFSGNSCMGTWMSEKAANYYNVSKDNPKWEAPGFSGITDKFVAWVENKLNNRPRKRLGYLTSNEKLNLILTNQNSIAFAS